MNKACFSAYKNRTTVKVLVTIGPHGRIRHVSAAVGGATSDVELGRHSGWLDTLRPGDEVLADKGFKCHEEVRAHGGALSVPHFATDNILCHEDLGESHRMSQARVHIERAIECVKRFHMLSNVVPVSMLPFIDDIIFVACWLTHYMNPIVDTSPPRGQKQKRPDDVADVDDGEAGEVGTAEEDVEDTQAILRAVVLKCPQWLPEFTLFPGYNHFVAERARAALSNPVRMDADASPRTLSSTDTASASSTPPASDVHVGPPPYLDLHQAPPFMILPAASLPSLPAPPHHIRLFRRLVCCLYLPLLWLRMMMMTIISVAQWTLH